MCHFITLVTPETHESQVAAIVARHGRRLQAMNNPAIASLLRAGERQYFTCKYCDCGTSLGMAREDEKMFADELARQRKRVARLNWSDAKIERWTRDKFAASRRPRPSVDTVDGWDALLGDLGGAGIREAGLLLHFYSGRLDQDFECSADPLVRRGDPKPALASLQEDVLTRFATGS